MASSMTIFRPQSWGEVREFAVILARSALCPAPYRGKPEDILIAIQHGAELGLAPVQAVQNIAVIGGRPAVFGDALIALCYAHPKCRGIREWIDGEEDARTAHCEMMREGQPATERMFSVADAKRAKLWDERDTVKRRRKDGAGTYETENDAPWHCYPDRMLQMRARGFTARDTFPDALKGLLIAEEARDIEHYEELRREATGTAFAAKSPPIDDDIPAFDAPASALDAPSPFLMHTRHGDVRTGSAAEWVQMWADSLKALVGLKDEAERKRQALANNEDAIAAVEAVAPTAAATVRLLLSEQCVSTTQELTGAESANEEKSQ